MTGSRVQLALISLFVSSLAEIIPRDLLFSDGKYAAVSLSPNGKSLAYIAPDDNGIKNVFTKCISCKGVRQVTFEKKDAVLSYQWTGVSDIILYMQDNNGDENTMIFKKNISHAAATESRFVVVNKKGVKAMIMANNREDSRVLVGINDATPAYHDIYSFDLITNQMKLVLKNKRFPVFVVDHALNIRLASEEQPDGTTAYFRLSSKANPKDVLTSDKENWIEYIRIEGDDKPITSPIAFDKSNKHMYWIWGEGSDLGQLVHFHFDTPTERTVLYTATRAQIGNIFFHPEDRTLLAVAEVYHKPELYVANDTVMGDLQYLVNFRPHASLAIMGIAKDMSTWLVTYISADKPFEIFVYRRDKQECEMLFNTHPQLEPYTLNKQIGFDFKTRDDMIIQAYISLPAHEPLRTPSEVPAADKGFAELGMMPRNPQKMVVMVHGGPKSRDSYGFSPMNAWLTSRGYAVLQVNFRGSVGFGKRLTNAGNGEWGRKMHFDLLDAVDFAVAKGIADRSQVAIMGGSYGGYATLVGLTFTPDVFACGVDIVGPSNLVSLLEAVPPYWLGFYNDLVKMVGADIDTDAGRQSLVARSPLYFADRVSKPVLILQGANDPRVKQQESDQFVAALEHNKIPVSYVLYPDEGHGFRKANNRLAQCGFIEKFLHSCLGGEYEPFNQGQYNSTAILKVDGLTPADKRGQTTEEKIDKATTAPTVPTILPTGVPSMPPFFAHPTLRPVMFRPIQLAPQPQVVYRPMQMQMRPMQRLYPYH